MAELAFPAVAHASHVVKTDVGRARQPRGPRALGTRAPCGRPARHRGHPWVLLYPAYRKQRLDRGRPRPDAGYQRPILPSGRAAAVGVRPPRPAPEVVLGSLEVLGCQC